ncbi:pyridoxal reductase chloroplastic isoform X2 [Prunus yedoensis var. nudiflora]|uniref:Pyridoxal reductase chloroplastic isoform X2 n=1 Tax=Prunus yedoensis var. nudiflora TaxID=2094558 RepID=A0A314XMH8_PRUYE|nr:pyridoxal reductase chloroplastic isoform X2 [Prunus yedoensis var. nudiflora]
MAYLTLKATAYFSSSINSSSETYLPSSPSKLLKLPPFWPWEKVKVGPLSVSPMGFGTWAWGNQLLWGYQESMDNELQQSFNLAVDNGINLFDTADSYGTGRLNGKSEKLLGKFIREYQGQKRLQKDIVIATKFAAYPWRLTPGQFLNACNASIDRMQIEQIGIGQLHWSTANYAPLQEKALWDGLVAMHDKGLVRAVGVSNYGPKQLVKIYDYLKARGVPLCTAQVQFSLLSVGEDQLEIKNICDSLGIRLIAYSPLGLGMLTGKYTPSNLPRGPRAFLFRQILPGLDPLLSALEEIAQKRRNHATSCHKLVHLQRDHSHTWSEDSETSRRKFGCFGLAPEFPRVAPVRICGTGVTSKDDPKHFPNKMNLDRTSFGELLC